MLPILAEKKFEKNIIVMLCISLFINFIFLMDLNSDTKTKDIFIRHNYPVLMDFLIKEITSLKEVASKLNSDSDETRENIKKKIGLTEFSIYNINDTLYETRRLNRNFNKKSSNLTDFLVELRDDIADDKDISDEQIQTLHEIISIAKKYGGRPSRASTYPFAGTNAFQRMEMPKETERFFDKIDSAILD
ncbi:MAG: hypothetical protein JJT76_19640 [Clostridiaceae bacterium]|nr:hypothetical protein [Clostridiaceae bacterium]